MRRQCGLRVLWLSWHQNALWPCASSVDQSRYLHRTDGGKSSRISGEISRIFLSCMSASSRQCKLPHQAHSASPQLFSCHLLSTKVFSKEKNLPVLGSVDLEMCVGHCLWTWRRLQCHQATCRNTLPRSVYQSLSNGSSSAEQNPVASVHLSTKVLPEIVPGSPAGFWTAGFCRRVPLIPSSSKNNQGHCGIDTGWVYRFYALYVHKLPRISVIKRQFLETSCKVDVPRSTIRATIVGTPLGCWFLFSVLNCGPAGISKSLEPPSNFSLGFAPQQWFHNAWNTKSSPYLLKT